MDKLGGEDLGQVTSIRQVAWASLVGTSIEWYDFFVYSTMAALVFNQLFFPTFEPLIGTLVAFSTFATGFIARPIGGLIAGHYGDRIGRKAMLILTLLIAGIATFIVGLLPTYDTIGVWAPILLITMRFLQGIGFGGEWGGAVLMAVEHSPRDKRGFYGSFPQLGIPIGIVLANTIVAAFASLPEEQFLSWGWRVPFLLSIVLVGTGLFIRLKIMETPVFAQIKESGTEARRPIIDVVRAYPRSTLLAMGARLSESTTPNIYGLFMIAYGTQQLGLPRGEMLVATLISAFVGIFTIPAFGALSDRIGRRPVYMGGALFTAIFAFPGFWLINTEETGLIWLALVLGWSVGWGMMNGPQAAFFSELFGTRVRYSGISAVYQIGALFSGAVAAAIATALLVWSGGDSWPVSVYLIVMALISFVSLYLTSETLQLEMSERQPRESQTTAEGIEDSGTG
jgi:MHS family shikimate/dehydroshikimate transporter-like MFS transporter